MVSLSTKRRGVAVVAVLTLGLLFGIALLMMQHALPIAETNFSSTGTMVRITLYTQTTTDAETNDDFNFVNTLNGKVVSQYNIPQPGSDQGKSKEVIIALNEELGELFCLCTTGEDAWDGQLTVFKVLGVSFPRVMTTLKLSKNDAGYYPCWRFGIKSNELVDKGHSETCSNTVSMTFDTLDLAYSDTIDDFTFVNTANGEAVSQYQLSQPGPDEGKSKTITIALNEELGDLFCICTTGDDLWEGELSVFKVNDVSIPGLVSTLGLSTDDPGYYPCWLFGIESDELVDKGHSTECSTTVSMIVNTLTDPNSQTGDDFNFVNTANGKEVAQYKLSQPASVNGQSKTISMVLNEQLGNVFCLCTTGEDAWTGEISGFTVGSVSYSGVISPVKLSTNDAGYYPCWRFGIESNELVDKGYSQECSVSTTEVSMNLHTLTTKTDSYTNDDVNFVNTADGKMVAQYQISQPGPVNGESKMVSLTLNEQLGNVFCLCAITDDAWDVEVSELKVGDVSFPGVVSPVRLSTNDTDYHPCWRFGIEWEELVDKGYAQECSMYTVSMTFRTLTLTDSNTNDNVNFVNTADGKLVGTYEIDQPGTVNGESRTKIIELNEELGPLFCLCATDGDAWDVEVSDFKVSSVSIPGVVSPVRLSKDDIGYYPCWRFGIDEESKMLVGKGHSDSCI